jgi:hypothetical protein
VAATAPTVELPIAAALVLRDPVHCESLQVLVTAIDELVAMGVWTTSNVRRGWRRRWVVALAPMAEELPELSEPLHSVDRVLRRVAFAHQGAPFTVEDAARWTAVYRREVPDEAVRATTAELIERGLLGRLPALAASAKGSALLRKMPLPAIIRPFANERQARRDAIGALSPVGATFVTAWIATLMLGEGVGSRRGHRADGADDPDSGGDVRDGSWWDGGDFGGGD